MHFSFFLVPDHREMPRVQTKNEAFLARKAEKNDLFSSCIFSPSQLRESLLSCYIFPACFASYPCKHEPRGKKSDETRCWKRKWKLDGLCECFDPRSQGLTVFTVSIVCLDSFPFSCDVQTPWISRRTRGSQLLRIIHFIRSRLKQRT